MSQNIFGKISSLETLQGIDTLTGLKRTVFVYILYEWDERRGGGGLMLVLFIYL